MALRIAINDNDATSFSIANATAVTEGGTLVYTVTKTGSGAASVNYASAGGTATSGSDFTATSGTLSFTSGQTSQTISLATIDGTAVESGGETVFMNLSGATAGATISDAQGVGEIYDNDIPTQRSISVADVIQEEGKNMSFRIIRSGNGGSFDVSYATSNGTASASSDYDAESGTVHFDAGDEFKTITIDTNEDSTTESDETFTLTISSTEVTISDGSATGTILNDDGFTGTTSTFRISDPQNYEDSDLVQNDTLVFEVYRTGPTNSGYSTSISYATSNGSAIAGSDYVAGSGTITFTGNQIYKTITIPMIDDTANEAHEVFNVTITPLTAGDTLIDGVGVGTIIDDD